MAEQQRFRLRFAKRDRLRFVSHHDQLLIFERALRRAKLTAAHTQGFNPRPKLTFALALPLGVESHDEIVDIVLEDAPDSAAVAQRLDAELPDGLDVVSCDAVALNAKLPVDGCIYYIDVPENFLEATVSGIERFHLSDAPTVLRERKGKTREINLKACVSDLTLEEGQLAFRLSFPQGGSAKPEELLTWLGLDPFEVKVVKTATILS